MILENFEIRFTINYAEVDISAALIETYLPAFAHIADAEIRIQSALETLAEDLGEGGDDVDFTVRTA